MFEGTEKLLDEVQSGSRDDAAQPCKGGERNVMAPHPSTGPCRESCEMWLGGRHAPPSAAHTLPRGSTDGLKTGLARAKILGMRERRELSRSRLTQIVSWSSIRACTTPADGEPTCQSRPYTTALSWASPDSPIATPTGPRRERVTTATPPSHVAGHRSPIKFIESAVGGFRLEDRRAPSSSGLFPAARQFPLHCDWLRTSPRHPIGCQMLFLSSANLVWAF